MAVVMTNVGDAGADGGMDAEFFLKFARESLFGAFTLFNLAAGELPLKGHGLIGPPLADQDQTISNQQPCNNEAEGWACRSRIGTGLRLFHILSVNGL